MFNVRAHQVRVHLVIEIIVIASAMQRKELSASNSGVHASLCAAERYA